MKILSYSNFILENFTTDYIEDILDSTHFQAFNTREEAKEELERLLNSSFPDGIKDIPDKTVLYRVLALSNDQVIDENNLGKHYVSDISLITKPFLTSIGISNEFTILYLLECSISGIYINKNKTLSARMSFPYEEEYYVDSPNDAKILNKIELDLDELSDL